MRRRRFGSLRSPEVFVTGWFDVRPSAGKLFVMTPRMFVVTNEPPVLGGQNLSESEDFMNQIALEESIAKAIFSGSEFGGLSAHDWGDDGNYPFATGQSRDIARDVMLCPELVEALAATVNSELNVAVVMVTSVEGLDSLPTGSIILSAAGVGAIRWFEKWVSGMLNCSSAQLIQDGPFSVLHVGGGVS